MVNISSSEGSNQNDIKYLFHTQISGRYLVWIEVDIGVNVFRCNVVSFIKRYLMSGAAIVLWHSDLTPETDHQAFSSTIFNLTR